MNSFQTAGACTRLLQEHHRRRAEQRLASPPTQTFVVNCVVAPQGVASAHVDFGAASDRRMWLVPTGATNTSKTRTLLGSQQSLLRRVSCIF